MANINPVDLSFFDSYAEEIAGKFQRLTLLTRQTQASGDYHEEILRSLLRNFLTKRYSVKTGFVYKERNQLSRQIDILIVDENSSAAYVFQEGDFAVVLPEAVVAVIEVKTTINVGQFDQGLENISSAKKLMEDPSALCGILFGYQSSMTLTDAAVLGWFARPSGLTAIANSRYVGPDAIVFFKNNYSLFQYKDEGPAMGNNMGFRRFRHTNDVNLGWQLSVVLALILGACENRDNQLHGRFGGAQMDQLVRSGMVELSDRRFILGNS